MEYSEYLAEVTKRGRPLVLTPYYGGKSRMLRFLLPLLPPALHFIEAFGGAANVLINRPPAEGREIYSDLSAGMVSLLTDLRDDPERTVWRIRFTPYSRRTFEEAREKTRSTEAAISASTQSVFAKADTWGYQRDCEGRRPMAVTDAERHGGAAHAFTSQSVFGGYEGWGIHKGTDARQPAAEANRAGVEQHAAIAQSMERKGTEWSGLRTPRREGQMRSFTEAGRSGADAHALSSQGMTGSAEKGWATQTANRKATVDRRRAYTESQRAGVGADVHASMTQSVSGGKLSGWRVNAMQRGGYTQEQAVSVAELSRSGTLSGEGAWKPLEETPLYRIATRLAGVEIYRVDALAIIEEWRDEPEALLYLDPPYMVETRKSAGDYMHEMTNEQHRDMVRLCADAKARIAISGYTDPLYDETLKDWRRMTRTVKSSAATGVNGARAGAAIREEVVWLNYNPEEL